MDSGTQPADSVLQKVTIASGKREKKDANLHFRLSPSEIYSWNSIVEKEGISSSNTIRKIIGLYPDLLLAKEILLAADAKAEADRVFAAALLKGRRLISGTLPTEGC